MFLNKPKAKVETVNDLHEEVVNYFKCLRDHYEELSRVINDTPYSRKEYDNAYVIDEKDSDIERARKFAIKCWQGFGCANLYHNGFKSGQQGHSPNCAIAWDKLPERLQEATKRLKNVQIENLDALELIRRYDTKDVFIYCDPPYLLSTRKSNLYKFEMSENQHIELLELLKKHLGKVMVSGYDNELYNSLLIGWHKEYKETLAEQGLKRVECLWMNYEIQLKLF